MPSGGVSERRLTELVPFMRELSPCSVPLQKTCDCSQRRLVETVCRNGAVAWNRTIAAGTGWR